MTNWRDTIMTHTEMCDRLDELEAENKALASKLDNAERGWAAASQSVLALESRLQGCEKAIAAIIRQVQPEWQPMVVANAITENPELRNVLEAAWPAGVERQES